MSLSYCYLGFLYVRFMTLLTFMKKRNMFRPVRLSCSQNYLAIIYQSFDHKHNDESKNASTAPN